MHSHRNILAIFLTANGLIRLIEIGKRLKFIEFKGVIDLYIDEHVFIALVNILKESDRDLYMNIKSELPKDQLLQLHQYNIPCELIMNQALKMNS